MLTMAEDAVLAEVAHVPPPRLPSGARGEDCSLYTTLKYHPTFIDPSCQPVTNSIRIYLYLPKRRIRTSLVRLTPCNRAANALLLLAQGLRGFSKQDLLFVDEVSEAEAVSVVSLLVPPQIPS